MFFRAKDYKVGPLGYWEKYSYMEAIIQDEVRSIKGIKVLDEKFSLAENALKLQVEYEDLQLELGFLQGTLPDYAIKNWQNVLAKEQKEEEIKTVLTIYMQVPKEVEALKAYHLQIKIAYACVPDMKALIDESAEKIIPFKKVKMMALEDILPNPKELYTVHIVNADGKIKFHKNN